MGTMTDYTDEERATLRGAGFGAMMLVSAADPGFFSMFKESMAGARALAGGSPELQQLFKSGGLPPMPKGSPAEAEADVMTGLRQSVAILAAKSPAELDGYRAVILAACDQVANASEGVKDTETAMIAKVRAALGEPGSPPPAAPTAEASAPPADPASAPPADPASAPPAAPTDPAPMPTPPVAPQAGAQSGTVPPVPGPQPTPTPPPTPPPAPPPAPPVPGPPTGSPTPA
jgi:hypothetical protein